MNSEGDSIVSQIKATVLGCLFIVIVFSSILGVLVITDRLPGGVDDDQVTYSCTVADDGTGTCLFTNTGEHKNRRRCVTLAVRFAGIGVDWKKEIFCSGGLNSGEHVELSFSVQEEWQKCSDMQNKLFAFKKLPRKVCDILVQDRR